MMMHWEDSVTKHLNIWQCMAAWYWSIPWYIVMSGEDLMMEYPDTWQPDDGVPWHMTTWWWSTLTHDNLMMEYPDTWSLRQPDDGVPWHMTAWWWSTLTHDNLMMEYPDTWQPHDELPSHMTDYDSQSTLTHDNLMMEYPDTWQPDDGVPWHMTDYDSQSTLTHDSLMMNYIWQTMTARVPWHMTTWWWNTLTHDSLWQPEYPDTWQTMTARVPWHMTTWWWSTLTNGNLMMEYPDTWQSMTAWWWSTLVYVSTWQQKYWHSWQQYQQNLDYIHTFSQWEITHTDIRQRDDIRNITNMYIHNIDIMQYVHRKLFVFVKNISNLLYNLWAGIAQLVVLGPAIHSVAGSILLWGHFPVEGIFPLELTWVQTPVPQKLLWMRV